MRINSLELTNFRQHASSRLEFDTGLTGIVGPNGAGKSTVLEAIAWAIYGQPAARGTRDSIRFIQAPPRSSVRVELDFELGGHRYRVVRGLSNAELYLDGGNEPIATSLSAVTGLLERRLGLSRTEFFQTYFTGQKELNVMSAMGPSERAQFLSRVLGYEKLRVAQDAVRDRRRLLTAELTGVRAAMPDVDAVTRGLNDASARRVEAERGLAAAEDAHRRAAQRLAEIGPGWAEAQRARERHAELTGELRVAESELAAHERDHDRLTGELQSTGAAREELTRLSTELAPLAAFAAEYARLEELAREEGKRATLTESSRALADELALRRDRRTRIAGAPQAEEAVTVALEAKRREVEDALGRIEGMRTAWVRDTQEAETKRDALRAQYAELKKQRDRVMELGEDGACPTCTRKLGENFRTVLDQLDEQMETITVDGRYFGTRLVQLEQIPPELQRVEELRRERAREAGELERQLARVQSEVQELSQLQRELARKEQQYEQWSRELAAIPGGYDEGRHKALEKDIDRLAPLNEQATRLSTLLEREPGLLADLARVRAGIDALRSRVLDLASARTALRFSEQDYAQVRDLQERTAAASRAAEVALAAATGELRAAQRDADAAAKAVADLQRARDMEQALLRDKRLHEELDRAYTDLRTDLNHALRPELSELASAFLAELTGHRYSELELDDQYNIVVLEDGRPKPVISGGEEDLTNLALRLAISQMIAERTGQRLTLLVLDEVFGSLDEWRQLNVVELLRSLQDRFEQVILITHVNVVRGLAHEIRLEYDEESGSTVVRAASASADPEELGHLLEGAGADA
ncbi:MAG: SMC family ATPase [Gemmatimonadaceae bacterium]|nr:SMC family ATPase [Gemmatimonadaceae bacterium]